jgi:AcrR family transcriptional regulator
MARLSAEERRSALVAAALTVIAREGVHGATTRAIVAEAGMSLASFHYAFRSRDELIHDVITFVVDNERQVTIDALDPGVDLRTTIRAAMQAYFDLLAAHPDREQALFELMHYAARTPELDGLPRAQHGSYLRAAETILTSASVTLGVTWSQPVAQVARVLIALTDGLTFAWLADRDDAAAAALMDFATDSIVAFANPSPLSPASPNAREHQA